MVTLSPADAPLKSRHLPTITFETIRRYVSFQACSGGGRRGIFPDLCVVHVNMRSELIRTLELDRFQLMALSSWRPCPSSCSICEMYRWLFDDAGSAWMLVCQRDCCQSLQPGNRQRRSVPWIEEWPCATCGSMFAKLGFERTSLKYLCCSRPFWRFACSFFAGGFPKLFFDGKPSQKTAKAGCYRFHQEVILGNFEGAINHKWVPLIKPSDPWSISTVNLPQTHSVHLCHRWMSSSKFPRCRACAEVTISILICTTGPTSSLLAFLSPCCQSHRRTTSANENPAVAPSTHC